LGRFGFPRSGAYGATDPDPAIGEMVEQVFDKGIIQYHLQDQKLYVSNSGWDLLLARQGWPTWKPS
jgi:hypothetical protein